MNDRDFFYNLPHWIGSRWSRDRSDDQTWDGTFISGSDDPPDALSGSDFIGCGPDDDDGW